MKTYRLKKGEYTLSEALEKMFKSYRLSDQVELTTIRSYWKEIAGEVIAKYTTDLYLRNKILYIKVANNTLKQELSYLKSDLLEAVNTYFKKHVVDEIVIN